MDKEASLVHGRRYSVPIYMNELEHAMGKELAKETNVSLSSLIRILLYKEKKARALEERLASNRSKLEELVVEPLGPRQPLFQDAPRLPGELPDPSELV